MSKQLKEIKAFPLADNTVKLVLNQEDYSPAATENKIIVAATEHWAEDKTTTHTHIKDGPGNLISVVTTDPLAVTSSGYATLDADGLDGLLVSADGYKSFRGAIKSQTDSIQKLINPASVSIGDHFYFMGGVDETVDAYQTSIWHSADGAYWEQKDAPPWDARANFSAVSDGSDVWVVGGEDAVEMKKDIWHGVVDTASGDITWDGSALYTGQLLLEDFTKAAFVDLTTVDYIAVGDGLIDLSDGSETTTNLFNDGYGTTTHYDSHIRTLWNSGNNRRIEQTFDTSEARVVNSTDFSYVHLVTTPATVWTVPVTTLGSNVVILCYDSSNNLLTPKTITDAAGVKTVTFNTNQTGRAVVLKAAAHSSNTTWTITADAHADMFYFANATWDIIEPTAITYVSGVSTTVQWNTAQVGTYAIISPVEIDELVGRKYNQYTVAMTAGDNTYNARQAAPFVAGVRTASGNLVIPKSVTSDSVNTTIELNAAVSAGIVSLYDARNDNLHDLDDPFTDAEYVSSGYNTDSSDIVYVIDENTTFKSLTGGSNWVDQTSTGITYAATRSSPIVAKTVVVATIDASYDISRSTDSGDNYSTFPGGSTENVFLWYGQLSAAIDDTWQLFIYDRPSDVVWESKYGYLGGEHYDDYSSHYILPYPAVPAQANTGAVQITLDTDYGKALTADELRGEWLYSINSTTGAIIQQRKITSNSAAAAGGLAFIYCEAFDATPTLVQVIHNRPEGLVYYSAITRDVTYRHDVSYNDDDSSFIAAQEQVYDWYGHMISNNGLPATVQTDSNEARINLTHAELNRVRVAAGQEYYNPYTVPPEFLNNLARQYGADFDDTSDQKLQRRAADLWTQQVSAYGFCKDGVDNLVELMLGAGSGISVSVADPVANTLSGKVVTVNLTGYADYNFTYAAATNTVLWDSGESAYDLNVSDSNIDAEIKTIKHSSFFMSTGGVISEPVLIKEHAYDASGGIVSLYFNDDEFWGYDLSEGVTEFMVFTPLKTRRLLKFINKLAKMTPHWVTVQFA